MKKYGIWVEYKDNSKNGRWYLSNGRLEFDNISEAKDYIASLNEYYHIIHYQVRECEELKP